MQDIGTFPAYRPDETQPPPRVVAAISLETIAYIALFVLALVLRVAQLDVVPLAPSETGQALAAWHIVQPGGIGEVASAPSPWLLLVQTGTFAVMGGTEFTARIGTALAGLALVFAPLLFRAELGRGRAFLGVLVLAFSPVLLLASRFVNPVVWSLLFAALGGWCALRFVKTRSTPAAITATILFVGMISLTDPAAWLLAAVLALALIAARFFAPADDDALEQVPAVEPLPWREWPWLNGLALAAFVIVLVATQFMLQPGGLSSIGALFEAGLRGLTTPQPGAPALYPLLVSVFYEPFFWLLALVGLVLAWQRGMASFADRFLVAWLVFGILALLLYVGATPAHALWLTIPLIGLVARAAVQVFHDDERKIWWDTPGWVPWLLALLTVGLMAILSIGAQMVARSLARQNPLETNLVTRIDPIGLILLLMVGMFFVVGFFLAANVWDRHSAGKGLVIGLLVFGVFTSLGSGWNAASPNSHLATEPWHLRTATQDATDLRATLDEVAKRQTRGVHTLPLVVQAAPDGVVAWLLRDYTNIRLIETPADVQGEEVVLIPAPGIDPPEPRLGGNYVGQDFIVTRVYALSQMNSLNILNWWLRHNMPTEGAPLETMALYLRADIYAGVED